MPLALKMASKILEDDFVLQYFFDEHLNLMQLLEKSILAPAGEVVLLQGDSGCGITTLLRTLQHRHPGCVRLFDGDMYIGNCDLVDHLCDAFNVRRGDYSKKIFPPHLLKVLSLTTRKTLLIDDLDIYISTSGKPDDVIDIIRSLTSKTTNLTVIVSTRNSQLLRQFSKCLQPSWMTYKFKQKVTNAEYSNFATRLWTEFSRKYSLRIPKISLAISEARYGLDIQAVNKELRLQFVELFLLQQGAVDALCKFKNIDEYENYVQAILNP